MFNQYRHKIKTVEELSSIIGTRPRQKKLVMCHGVFDIVHPGHIRHLLYAKSQGDVLIASLTCDEFISKAADRPYVPQELRAVNLAALEMIDYVLIDIHPEPLTSIAALQPDYFVKGFEYSVDGTHPKTRQEMEIVSSYGGEFLFSPGDVIYSSSRLLAQHKPSLKLDKLVTTMQAEGVTFDYLQQTLEQMNGVRVHVVGDTIVDKYSYCTLLGPSTKTPTFSVKLDKSELFVGGAGIVAKHLRSLGAEVTFTTVLGRDDLAEFVVNDLSAWQIKLNIVCDVHRPTTLKERFWTGNYKLLQVDVLDNSPLSTLHVEEVKNSLLKTPTELVVFSDFRHGLFHSSSIPVLIEAVPPDTFKVADSQVSNRWGNILDFKGFDLITPNEHEARFALGDQDSGVRHLAQRLLNEAQAKYLILKLGERGILCFRQKQPVPRSFFYIESFVERLVDAVGAGDALLAAASLSLVRSQDIVQSAIIGNLAAAVACELEGNVPVECETIAQRLRSLQSMVESLAV